MSGIASSSDEQLLAALRKHIKSGGSMRQHRAAARALLREARDAIGRQSAERRREESGRPLLDDVRRLQPPSADLNAVF